MSEPISKGGTAHPRLTRQQKAAAVIVSLGTDKDDKRDAAGDGQNVF